MMKKWFNQDILNNLLWSLVPIFIGGLGTLIYLTIDNQAKLSSMAEKDKERGELQMRMWEKIDQNNTILITKADEAENKKDHEIILGKVTSIEKKVDKLNMLHNLTTVDTNYIIYIPYKQENDLVMNIKK